MYAKYLIQPEQINIEGKHGTELHLVIQTIDGVQSYEETQIQSFKGQIKNQIFKGFKQNDKNQGVRTNWLKKSSKRFL